ncbi:hypothetical protein SR870_10625 [Rhodopseudomonas palustris]|uniref:hypothetical protein n=1 Tax=Rhodopseudomonas palustris TaxID=1076 RepID=UPI002ACE6E90|nr:hypothetical protein [Rhodopseudomonas palustris]WQH01692.1 hypothetical protein SR870_10625 [Rhodopseudomonas palustris]
MKDWFAACAVGLVIIVGSAAGLGGTLAFLLAFGIAWYLLAARDIGFAAARNALDIKLLPPIWRRGNWMWLDTLFGDGDKLLKAATVALAVTGAGLMFRADIVYGAALLIAAFYVSEILRGTRAPPPRGVRIPDAGAHGALIETAPANAPPTSALAAPATTVLSAIVAPPIIPAATSRVLVVRPRELRKPVVLKQRPIGRRPDAKRTKRPARDRSKQPQPQLPSRKPDHPIAIRRRKPQRPRPLLRRRTICKPSTPVGRRSQRPVIATRR